MTPITTKAPRTPEEVKLWVLPQLKMLQELGYTLIGTLSVPKHLFKGTVEALNKTPEASGIIVTEKPTNSLRLELDYAD